MNITWTTPRSQSGASFSLFLVQYNTTNTNTKNYVMLFNSTSSRIDNLQPSSLYSVQVVAVGPSSETLYSCSKMVKTGNGEITVTINLSGLCKERTSLIFEGFPPSVKIKRTIFRSEQCSVVRHAPLYAFDSATLSCILRNSPDGCREG